MKKTALFENGLLWFGAAVSLAEILTGTYFAPLGFEKGLIAIIIGHIIGFVLYRVLMNYDFLPGSTLPDMVITLILCVAVNKIFKKSIDK